MDAIKIVLRKTATTLINVLSKTAQIFESSDGTWVGTGFCMISKQITDATGCRRTRIKMNDVLADARKLKIITGWKWFDRLLVDKDDNTAIAKVKYYNWGFHAEILKCICVRYGCKPVVCLSKKRPEYCVLIKGKQAVAVLKPRTIILT